jgi:hypothetical protein
MQYLRQSTASQSVLIGPFVASTDGVTAETGLTINAADIRLSANGGNMVAKNSLGGTHDEAGWYTITLDATDTATVGRLQLSVAVSGALPVFAEFQVLEEALYDALFAASATGLLPANVTQVAGQTASATGVVDFDDLATIEGLASGATGFAAIDTVVDAVKVKTDQLSFATWGVECDLAGIGGSNIPVGNLASDYDGTGYNRANSTIGTVSTVTAFAGTITTLDALDTAQDSQHSTTQAAISGLNDLSAAEVNAQVDSAIETYHLDHLFAVDYDPASPPGTATALLNELIEPDGGVSRFTVNALENAPSGTGASAAAIADAVWEEAIADHSGTSGSTAEALNAAGSAGDPWTTALPGSYTGTQAGKILSDVLTDTADLQANQGNWLTATGFSTHDASAVVTALGTGSTLSALATAAELAKVPKSDGAVSWNATALASINTQCDTAISDAALATAAALATVDSNVDAILVDTGTTLPASIATIDTNVDAILVDTGTTIPGTITTLQSTADAIETDTQDLQTQIGNAGAGLTDLGGMSTAMKAEVQAECVDALQETVPDSIPADGTRPNMQQAAYMILQSLTEFAISGTTITVKKPDGSTTLFTNTLDDGTNPTSSTRAT